MSWLCGGWPLALALATAPCGAQMAERCVRLTAAVSDRAVVPQATLSALRQRPDQRAAAVADYLLAASGAPDAGQARQRLQDRARAATDPLLTVLALQMPCTLRGCRNIEASQWSRLEPANLFAWLALPDRNGADGRYLLQEIATHVQQADGYRRAFDEVLAGLPPSGVSLREPWAVLNLATLGQACREPKDALTAERCDKVAELLWADGGAIGRLAGLVIAHQALALAPARRAVWEPRRRALEVATRTPGQPWAFVNGDRPPERIAVCQALDRQRSPDGVSPDDWVSARHVVQAAGLRLGDLRPRTRADAMRSP